MRHLLLVLLSVYFFNSAFAYAYTVTCEKNVAGQWPFRISIAENESYPDIGWAKASIINEFSQGDSYSVIQTSRKNKVLFNSITGKKDFSLDLGEFKGEGQYASVAVSINSDKWFGRQLKVDCKITGDVAFVNYCTATEKWSPEKGLLLAAKNKNFDLLEATLDCGAAATIKDDKGCTPMLLASDNNCGSGYFSTISSVGAKTKDLFGTLIDNGAYIDDIDPKTGESPLIKVVRTKDQDAADFLLALEANIDLQDLDGNTALIRATENNDYWMVNSLVSAGANTKLKNHDQQTALDIAKVFNYKKLIPLLGDPESIVTIEGRSDGSCSIDTLTLSVKKLARTVLKSTANQMFKFEVADLEIEITSEPAMQSFKNILPTKIGDYKFTCGLHHGGGTPTNGTFTIK